MKLNAGRATVHNKMGSLALQKGEIDEAFKSFESAQKIAKDVGMKPLEGTAFKNMSQIHAQKGDWQKAVEAIDEAIHILRGVDIPDELQDSLDRKGRYLERKGDLPGAEKSYRESVEILNTFREGLAVGEEVKASFAESREKVYQRLVNLLLKQGKSSEGLKYIAQGSMKKTRDDFDQIKPELSDKEEKNCLLYTSPSPRDRS